NSWLTPMDEGVADAEGFDQDDILTPMAESMTVDGEIYGEPFYGEGSFLMYRTDIFDKAGVEMPENPTWDDVAELAAKADGREQGRPGRFEGVQGCHELLRRPHQGPRGIRRPAGRIHRMPDEPAAGQGRHVVRLDGRHRHPRSRRLPGQGQDRLRRGPGERDG